MKTAISIIIPVHNAAEYLRYTMECLKNQTFHNFEIICVDDCSTDDSYQILMEYMEQFSNLQVVRNEKNVGAGESRNIGLSRVRGEYVIFLDADDLFENNLLEKVHHCAVEEKADIVVYYTGHFWNEKANGAIPDRKGKNWANAEHYPYVFSEKVRPYIYELITNSPFDKLVKKSLLEDNQIVFPNYPYSEDMVFSYECMLSSSKTFFLDDVLYFHRRTSIGSLSQRLFEKKSYIVSVLQDIFVYEKLRNIPHEQEMYFWEFAMHRMYDSLRAISQNFFEELLSQAQAFLKEYYVPFLNSTPIHSDLCELLYEKIEKGDNFKEEYAAILRGSQKKKWAESKKKCLAFLNNRFASLLYKKRKLTDYYINDNLMTYAQLCKAMESMLRSKLLNCKHRKN